MHKLSKLLSKKVITFALLFVAILSITTICASFNQQMYISGDAYLRVDRDIRITQVALKNPTNSAYETYKPKYAVNQASVFLTLPNTNSTITYTVTIKNKSSDIYMITAINNDFSNASIQDNENSYLASVISPNSEKTIDITFNYNTSTLPQNTQQSGTINFTFEKPSASLIQYTSSYTSCSDVQCSLDELFEILG